MTKLTLIKGFDPALITPCQPFDFSNPPMDPEELVRGMMEIMDENNGMGLAANQCGLPYRVFVTNGAPFACFNPKLVDVSSEEIVLDEACLSFPGLTVKVKRPKSVRIRFQSVNGDTFTEKFGGLTARCLQHEMNHLDGILFYNQASRYHRDSAMRKYNNAKPV